MKRMIEVNSEQITDLVVDDLKAAYRMADNNEVELINAIDVVLHYYMTPDQIKEWNGTKGEV